MLLEPEAEGGPGGRFKALPLCDELVNGFRSGLTLL
jgi:hypothetical protein